MTAVAGSNTLTGLIPVIYEAMDVIPRELVGAIGAVQMDPSAEMAGLGQIITSHVVPPATAVDIVPGVTNTFGQSQTIGTVNLSITKSKNAGFVWSGEEQLLLKAQYASILKDQFAQAFRTLGNLVEQDVVNGIAAGASRTVGTAGTTPFGISGNLSDFANSYKFLDDVGAPSDSRSLILGTTAAANIRGVQTVLFKANEAGSDTLLRTGQLGIVENFAVRTSGQIKSGQGANGQVAGTGVGYVIASGPFAVGATSVTVGTGTGTILVGDVVTIGGASYVAQTGISAPGAFSIASPGLLAAAANGATVNVVTTASLKNLIVQKAGFLLATRLPAMPAGGDSASDMIVVTDPVSNLSFQIAMYKQYRQISIDVAIAWGTKALRSDYCGILLG
jgi:hypothetical protein